MKTKLTGKRDQISSRGGEGGSVDVITALIEALVLGF